MRSLPTKTANDNSEALDTAIEEAVRAFRKVLAVMGDETEFAKREEATLGIGNEVMRRSLTQDLITISDKYNGPLLRANGKLYKLHQKGTVGYHSLVGNLRIGRPTYREVGVRNGATIVPLDLAAGLMERATPAMAHRVVLGHGDGHSRRLSRELAASRRDAPSRATLEALGKRLGGALARDVVEIENEIRTTDRVPTGTVTIAIGLDRTSTPMREELIDAQRPATTSSHSRRRPIPYEVSYRMAYIGTVCFVGSNGRVLGSFRYGAAAEDGPNELLSRLMADVRTARQERRSLRVIVIQDAAKEMWNLTTQALDAEPSVHTHYEVIDYYHAVEHLAELAAAMDVDTERQLTEWKTALREDDDAILSIRDQVAAETREPYVPHRRTTLQEGLVYLNNNHARLHFADLRDAGFPIGSGPTEGACKSLVTVRCKRSGQSWSTVGLRAALESRIQVLNGRLPTAVSLLRKRRYLSHIQLAA